MPNQEQEFALMFGNGLVHRGSSARALRVFSLDQTNCPWVSEDTCSSSFYIFLFYRIKDLIRLTLLTIVLLIQWCHLCSENPQWKNEAGEGCKTK